MSKKPVILRKHTADTPTGDTYKATDNEVWRTNADGHTRLAVVVKAIDGSLDAETRHLAKICADALNKKANAQAKT